MGCPSKDVSISRGALFFPFLGGVSTAVREVVFVSSWFGLGQDRLRGDSWHRRDIAVRRVVSGHRCFCRHAALLLCMKRVGALLVDHMIEKQQ